MWDKPALMLWLANLLYAVAAILLMYAVLFLVVHLPLFPLREVKVNGELKHVTREQVQFIVTRALKGNFFTLDLNKTRRTFEKLPWVRNVNVRRRWPDKLEVTMEEHEVLARWNNTALVNTQGELFQAASDQQLPIFSGPADGVQEVASQYEFFRQQLAKTGRRPVTVNLSPRRAWQIKLDDGLVVELGREHVEQRMEKFVKVYDRTLGRLAQLQKAVDYVDLRYPNGFAVRMGDTAAHKPAGA
ncbi:MAG: cell division protein FtsQ/DivIB [Gammaproteobacteria bacterium]|nr:cell division protein FtsQ/DivIB [Gammaproteobacteria bacterium]MBU1733319.1 cell division protein FtsQ/DivIB [Gammaproteobacteria bacterium]MBU1892367.1 cell division protein FtsQ/DivIB [Gammaproteobacteria bacterium]